MERKRKSIAFIEDKSDVINKAVRRGSLISIKTLWFSS